MKLTLGNIILLIVVVILTLVFFSPTKSGLNVNFNVKLISYFNFLLFVTSMVSIKQFIWPGDENRLPFHYFNIIFTVVFYSISFSFLFNHKDYYEYGNMSNSEVFRRFCTSFDLFSIMFWLILCGLIFNIMYIIKYRKSYFKYQ